MGNSNFNFKQFTINQHKSAMKVGTDGVLLGAWANCCNTKNVLDIGSGTGLIAIMIAQRCNASIDAVEIDADSYRQSLENIAACPWNNRITAHHSSIQSYVKNTRKKYDLIVSNPPFFSNSLKPQNINKTISKHTDLLSFNDLIDAANNLLSDNGLFSVILPYVEGLLFLDQCLNVALFCTKKTTIFPTPLKKPSRLLLEFRKNKLPILDNTITIELSMRHEYSEEYLNLTKDFYL